MFYYPNLDVVYCPIERTASRSTESYLFKHDPNGYRLGNHRHSCSAEELDGISPAKIYVSTRHPWDRFCSMFASDKEKSDAGFMIHWSSFDEYIDFQLAHKDFPFLMEDNSIVPNVFCPMHKVVNQEFIHFHRSQSSYLAILSQFENVMKLPYEEIGLISNEDWVNSSIEFPNIGTTNSESNSYHTVERENKVKIIFEDDYIDYSNWSVI